MELERENCELCRASEILKSAAAFFALELDSQPRSSRLLRRLSGGVRDSRRGPCVVRLRCS